MSTVDMVAVKQTAKKMFSDLLLDFQSSNVSITEEEKNEMYDKILSDVFCDAFLETCVEDVEEGEYPSYFGSANEQEMEYPFGV